jgi:CRP/FNR family transcriptional regulator
MGCECDAQLAGHTGASLTCLGHLWLFEHLQPGELQALLAAAERLQLRKGQEVFSQGQSARRMYLIKVGRVKLTKLTEGGDELTLDLRKAGDFLGETMFLEDAAYPLTAACLEDSLTCGFTREGFEALVRRQPNIGLQVIKNLSRRIDWLTSRVGSLALNTLEERLYQVLAQVAREHGVPRSRGTVIQFPLTHEELGFLVGAHRVSITRALKALKAAGKVFQEGKALVVA